MKYLIILICLIPVCNLSAELMCILEGGSLVLSWDEITTDFSSIEIRGATIEFTSEDFNRGAIITSLFPDEDTGLFPASYTLPGSFVVDPDGCIGCEICVSQCPVAAIVMVEGKAWIDPERCIACGICTGVCPVEAIFAPGSCTHFALIGINEDGTAVFLESI